MKLLNSAISRAEDADSLKDYQQQLVALLGVKTQAYGQLVELQ